jgi:hypothetical protein
MIVSDLLPAETYALLLDTMPPADTFEVADRVKANFDPAKPPAGVPERSRQTWAWFHDDVVERLLTPTLFDAFLPALAEAYRALYSPALADDALRIPHHAFRGRLMLRRPGYRLKPHRDMKNAALTGLIYFAQPGDSPDYGTDLYRIENDQQAPFLKTYYPEAHGGRAELVSSVPFVGNSALVFMNVAGMAHGAHIPDDATQAVRYAYQFYVGVAKSKLKRLVGRMPPELAASWGDLQTSEGEY